MIFLYKAILVWCLEEKGSYKHCLFILLRSNHDYHVTVYYKTKNPCL